MCRIGYSILYCYRVIECFNTDGLVQKRHNKLKLRPFCTKPLLCCMFIYEIKYCLLAQLYINGFVQERRNSSANALELGLYCTNPLIEKLGP